MHTHTMYGNYDIPQPYVVHNQLTTNNRNHTCTACAITTFLCPALE